MIQNRIASLGGLETDSVEILPLFSDQLYDQGRVEMDNKALELQSAEVQTRAAAAVATKEHNLAMVSPSVNQFNQSLQLGRPLTTCYHLRERKDGRKEAAKRQGRSD